MPRIPTVPRRGGRREEAGLAERPLTNYHNRGDIDFRSCSQSVLRAGRLLRPRRPLHREAGRRCRGSRTIYADWIRQVQARRLPRRHRAARERGVLPALGAEDPGRRAKAAGVNDFQIFGEVPLNDDVELSAVRARPRAAERARLPVPGRAAGFAAGRSSPTRRRRPARRTTTTSAARPASRRRRRPSSATTTWAARRSRSAQTRRARSGERARSSAAAARLRPAVPPARRAGRLLRRRGRDDRPRRRQGRRAQDMFPTQVDEWKTQQRVGSPPIGNGSSFDVPSNPIEAAAAGARRAARREPGALDRLLDRPLRAGQRCSPSAGSTRRRGASCSSLFNSGRAAGDA